MLGWAFEANAGSVQRRRCGRRRRAAPSDHRKDRGAAVNDREPVIRHLLLLDKTKQILLDLQAEATTGDFVEPNRRPMLFAGRHLEISEPQNGQHFAISKNKQNPSEGGVLLAIGNEGAAFPGSNSRNRLAAISRIKNAIKDRKFVGKTSIPKMAIIASSQRRSNRASSCVPITDQKRQGGHDVALFPGWHEDLNGCNG